VAFLYRVIWGDRHHRAFDLPPVDVSVRKPFHIERQRTHQRRGSVGGRPCKKNAALIFEFSLCLSRACLGKKTSFNTKMAQKKYRFLTFVGVHRHHRVAVRKRVFFL
jgi:hypothetical protein